MSGRVRRVPRAQVRLDLLDAAARVIARRGLHAASVEEIADEAGLSTGAVYSNFKGKDDLFLRLYEERIARRATELRALVTEAGPTAVAAAVVEAFRRERDWFVLYFEFALHAGRDGTFRDQFEAVRAEGLEALATGLADAFARFGFDIAASSMATARAIRALVYGFALDSMIDESSVSEPVLADAMRLVFKGARPDAPPDTHGVR